MRELASSTRCCPRRNARIHRALERIEDAINDLIRCKCITVKSTSLMCATERGRQIRCHREDEGAIPQGISWPCLVPIHPECMHEAQRYRRYNLYNMRMWTGLDGGNSGLKSSVVTDYWCHCRQCGSNYRLYAEAARSRPLPAEVARTVNDGSCAAGRMRNGAILWERCLS